MTEPRWLSRRIIDAVHRELIQEHGGRQGVRDSGLIDSALGRPQHRWAYEREPDLAELTAAYGFGLAKNHGFVDGNKRIALATIALFLRINGWRLSAAEAEAVVVITDLAAGSVSEEELASWIRARMQPLP
ncbi:MAG TPA: type II toxin-antitoxin system death-on-curing family toxin [Longimicrobiaceae bacterium]|nr:type II toxin-antitoxin system death-on-curing family toxin [Longimicrobiaceae bacterium]